MKIHAFALGLASLLASAVSDVAAPTADVNEDAPFTPDPKNHHHDEEAQGMPFTPDADNYGHDEEADDDKATSSSESTATVAWAVPVAIGGVLVSGGGAFLLARKHKTAATQRPEMGALDSQA